MKKDFSNEQHLDLSNVSPVGGSTANQDNTALSPEPAHNRKSFKTIQEFREQATTSDLQDMEDYIYSLHNRSKEFKCPEYPFSYTTAANLLREKGYLGDNRKTTASREDVKKAFVIDPGRHPSRYIPRSFSIEEDILGRLKHLEDENWQYQKQAIFNKLLDDALSLYGF